MNITRRGLLGMFAAGAAAAVLPSGMIMPVRRIRVPSMVDWINEGNAFLQSADYVPGVKGWRIYRDDILVAELNSHDGFVLAKTKLQGVIISMAVGELPRQSGRGLA